MGETNGPGMGAWLQARARTVTDVSAALMIVGSLLWFMAQPYVKPFLDMPERLDALEKRAFSFPLQLPIAEFVGRGVVLDPPGTVYQPGGTVPLIYKVRRNVSCDVRITPTFINLATNRPYVGQPFLAIKAPVTQTFVAFPLAAQLPDNLPAGWYVYDPDGDPVECGIYTGYNPTLSDPFYVGNLP